jgi:hypothetical protein
MASFYTDDDIRTRTKAHVQTHIPTLTNFSNGSPESAIIELMAYVQGLENVQAQTVWRNIFPDTMDLTGAVHHYQTWGLTWNEPTLAEARKTILQKYREPALGTASWYEITTVAQFGVASDYTTPVTQCYCFPGMAGANTIGLFVLSNGGEVMDTTLTAIETYFNDPTRKIGCFSIAAATRSTIALYADYLAGVI